MKHWSALLLFASALWLLSAALAADFTGRVVGVADGDTITVLHKGKGERIQLHGIDCPEKRQAFGKRAKQFTSTLVFGKTVTVHVLDRDRYGRTVGEVLAVGWTLTESGAGQSGVSSERRVNISARRSKSILLLRRPTTTWASLLFTGVS